MRILHLVPGLYPAVGVTEKLIQRLSEEFVRQFGDEVTVLTTTARSTEDLEGSLFARTASGRETINGVSVRRVPVSGSQRDLIGRARTLVSRLSRPSVNSLSALSWQPAVRDRFRRAIESEPADVIAGSSHSLRHLLSSHRACTASGRPHVLYGGLDFADMGQASSLTTVRVINTASRYVAWSSVEADYLSRRGIASDRLAVIAPGVDLQPYLRSESAATRQRLGVKPTTPIVGCVGLSRPDRGVNTLLLAIRRIWRQFPDAHLLIAGVRTAIEGSLGEALERWPVEDRKKIIVLDTRNESDTRQLLAIVDVVAYPGFESCGTWLLEAWAASKPVVSGGRGPIAGLVEGSRDGLVVNFEDEGLLADAAVLLLTNPDWSRALGEAGRRKVQVDLTWEKVARRVRSVLEAASREPRSATNALPVSRMFQTPVPEAAPILEQLPRASGIQDFHSLLARHRILGSDRRFIHLEIDVSNKCNIRCRMCHFSFDRHFYMKPAHLSAEAFASVADVVLPYADSLMLSLGSEPLMSPHFVPILKIASRYEVPNLGFYTNGLLMGDQIADALIEHGVTLVAISVDGANKQTFETIRRGADFDRLLDNVRNLVARRAAAGRSRPKLRFGVTMMRQNIRELEDIVSLAWRLGVEELNFFHVIAYEGLEMEEASLVHDKPLSNACLKRALDRAYELGLTVVHTPDFFSLEKPAVSQGRKCQPLSAPMTPYCSFPFFHVSVNARLEVQPCPFAHGEAAFGVVSVQTPFEAIWLGSKFTDLRTRILTNDPPAMCRRCSFLASSHPDVTDLFAPRDVTNSTGPSSEERQELRQ